MAGLGLGLGRGIKKTKKKTVVVPVSGDRTTVAGDKRVTQTGDQRIHK